ncbi:hypothetical protein AOL_s00173g349 [Orbilia oligospora ATCC 24927]|uniref:Uncharacterized protein n=1 Tax=Arthrobotrys oligospora (strain ATCC 24927 / CBS 115.81 / DSM 1491) TaxID=756982 RepID=G1XPI1_ARTOA|nr:hypothetical protein AOL_s00173g349 [Orbilia oligospora ATCC 24927]EGX45248.1 hypothetical protein AOL_s00173g349 [Orbilia oligospora ATCC 24927]
MDKQDPDRSAIDTEGCSPGGPGRASPRERISPEQKYSPPLATEPTQTFHEDGMCKSKPQKNYNVSKNNDRWKQKGPARWTKGISARNLSNFARDVIFDHEFEIFDTNVAE